MKTYSFGYLAYSGAYKFAGGEIVPKDNFNEVKEWVAKYAHKDGFIYPPVSQLQGEEGEPLPNTERPAHLHHIPGSHELRFDDDKVLDERHRPDASFIIHLVGYLHETLFQFEDWWFDSRVPLGKYSLSPSTATNEHFLSYSYQTWQKWPERTRKRFANVLFMLNRAPSYEWDWEHFVIEYIVCDALYATAVDLLRVPKHGSHAERINRLCKAYGLQENSGLVADFVEIRNDLFHEALWDGGQPGTAGPNVGAFMARFHIRRLNQRLIPAILGYNNDFVRSDWWTRGAFLFDVPTRT